MRAALALFALLSASSLAQLRAQTPAASKSFVIADVHVSPFTSNPFMHGNSIQGDRYFLTQATMVDLIATAYGVDAVNVQGGPTWLERDRYDIRAKVPPKTTRTTSSSCFAPSSPTASTSSSRPAPLPCQPTSSPPAPESRR